jgi:hypothetical protein
MMTFESGILAAATFLGLSVAQWVVLSVVVAAFVGAWLVARKGQRGLAQPLAGTIEADIIPTDLLEATDVSPPEPRIMRVFEVVFLVVLMGYAFMDRGFAWFHIPGTPLFVGELMLILGVAAMVSTTTPVLTAIRRSPPLKILLVLMGWGLGLLLFLGLGYGVDAIRDSAIWYYGSVAILAVFIVISNPLRIQKWFAAFAKILPWLIGWLFVSVVLDATIGGTKPPFVPDSQVGIFTHRAGNTAVIMVIGLAFVWLVDRGSKYFTPSQRIAITAAASVLLLFVGLKNRGGLVAGGLGVIAILFFMNRKRSELLVTMIGVAVLLASIALVSQVNVALFGEREISAEQFVSNITSIVSPGSGRERETSTTEWRLELWTAVLNDVNSEFPLTGYGPGPDLGKIYDVSTNVDVPLRNPHNSHVGVVARLGWVGFGIWIVLWSVWALLLLDLRTRLARLGRQPEAGVVAVLLIGAGMMLVNAFFDPTLEGPQVGVWLWFFFGLGAALLLVYHGFPALRSDGAAVPANEAGFRPPFTLDGATD